LVQEKQVMALALALELEPAVLALKLEWVAVED
jgi:hypothetical protein